MIRRWIQHCDCRVVRGDGLPPSEGDVYLFGTYESESASIIDGTLVVEGKTACLGTYTFEMVSGEVLTIECDNAGKVVSRSGGSS